MEPVRLRRRALTSRPMVLLLSAALVAALSMTARAQEQFQVFMFAMDREGTPVLDLTRADISMKEATGEGEVVRVERFGWPLKVTILFDNGPRTESMLVHVRSGLKRFFDGLPRTTPVSLIATAPNPRWLIRDTTDRVQIERGINLITPDTGYGRFADAMIEYSKRLDEEFRNVGPEQLPPYLPVLIVISTTAQDGSLVRKEDNIKMILSLRKHQVWTNFVMVTPSRSFASNDLATEIDIGPDEGQIGELAKAIQENTGGRYFPLGGSGTSALNSKLLPDLAKDITLRYIRQMMQHRIVIERPDGATGPLNDFVLNLNRPGHQYVVSLTGSMP